MLNNKKSESNLRIILAKNIKYYREKSGLSEEELSLKIGKNNDYIRKLESLEFKKNPPIYVVDSISKELRVSFEILVDFKIED